MFNDTADCIDFLNQLEKYLIYHGSYTKTYLVSSAHSIGLKNTHIRIWFEENRYSGKYKLWFSNGTVYTNYTQHIHMSFEDVMNQLPKELAFNLMFHLDKL